MLEDTLMEPLSKLREPETATEKTLPDLSIDHLRAAAEAAGLQLPESMKKAIAPKPAQPGVPASPPDAGKESPDR
jgi:hypothetical protein